MFHILLLIKYSNTFSFFPSSTISLFLLCCYIVHYSLYHLIDPFFSLSSFLDVILPLIFR
ncbi:hypothetical protein BDN72DRAFT_142868 [Pluteus cervinus]|uniref:Uncharacterized protein n=1 Tax=Pluteus cervinus TaxID=181527 RepID=A0ACD3AM47_9AGAR|nr:hypothetical protein BDN72DRAFT_142868 [Pluteus cervinus]